MLIGYYSPASGPTELLAIINLLSIPLDLPVLDISYKWNLKISGLCTWLLSLSIMFLRRIHIVACISSSFFRAE